MSTQHFHWADYVVFVAFLIISLLIGLFFGYRDRKKMTSKNFLTGGRNMHWSLVALSMQASFLSAIFIISIPIEVYAWGTTYYFLVVSYFIALPFAGHFIMPVYYKMNVTSAYEYLEERFNKIVRTACAVTFVFQILLYLSVVLYTPALALAQVTGLPIWLCILICGIVCTCYTVAGGMKATIWNDFFQMMIIALTLVILIIYGTLKVGGMTNVWEINARGGRIWFSNFQADPTIRTTFWTQFVGGFFVNMSMYAGNQTTIQKYISVKTLAGAKKSIWLAAFSTASFLTLVCLIGLVLYAYYETCDPLFDGKIEKYDQLVPLFVMDVVGHLHGLPGLFIAAAFSAALSSISGSLNALSAVTLTDFIGPAYKKFKKSGLSERKRSILSRVLTLSYGLLSTALGFAAQYFGEVVFQVAFSIFGFVGGPLTCVVALGIFFPFVTSLGAMCGLVSSLVVTTWIAIGAIIMKVDSPKLPMRNDGCEFMNASFTHHTISSSSEVLPIYKISFMYYGLVAMIVSFIVAIVVSLVAGRQKTLDERLVIDWYEDCCCCGLTNKIRTWLICGVTLVKSEDKTSEVSKSEPDSSFENLGFDEKNEKSIGVDPFNILFRKRNIGNITSYVNENYETVSIEEKIINKIKQEVIDEDENSVEELSNVNESTSNNHVNSLRNDVSKDNKFDVNIMTNTNL